MTSEEAKVLLHAYQPDALGVEDPRVAEALAQTRRDPELRAWFDEQRAFDAAVGDKLQQVYPPAGLAEKILTGRTAPLAPARKRYLRPLALAASLVFLFAVGALLLRPKPSAGEYAALRTDMAGFLKEFPRLDLATDQWPVIQRWLAQKPFLARAEIPAHLQKYPGIGCREVAWRGKRLMLVCFAAQGEIVHLFVAPRADLPDAPVSSVPLFASVKGWNTATWSQGDIAYLALTRGGEPFLKGLISEPRRI
jgi:hypothetical protein